MTTSQRIVSHVPGESKFASLYICQNTGHVTGIRTPNHRRSGALKVPPGWGDVRNRQFCVKLRGGANDTHHSPNGALYDLRLTVHLFSTKHQSSKGPLELQRGPTASGLDCCNRNAASNQDGVYHGLLGRD